MFIGELERLDQAENLIDVATNGGIVHGDVADDALVADNEQASESVSFLLHHDIVLTRDLAAQISQKRNAEGSSQAAFLAGGVHPGEMSEVGVHGGTKNLATDRLELSSTIAEGQDLSRTHKGEV